MENTAKNFALQLGSLIALYTSIGALVALLFGIINVAYPDAAEGSWAAEYASNSIRFSIAILVVFFPAYVILTRLVNTIRRSEHGTYLTLTKWLIYLSLVIGGGVLLGDLVAVINEFLNGELTTRFLLKALALLIIVGSAFIYYLLDARNYWQAHERESIRFGMGAGVVVIATLILGFFHTETPATIREQRIDEQQIADLQNIQGRIVEYYQVRKTLPTSIEAAFVLTGLPEAPEDRASYDYNLKTPTSFELCASFDQASKESTYYGYGNTYDVILNGDNWEHEAGTWCFERFMQDTIPQMGDGEIIYPDRKPMIAP